MTRCASFSRYKAKRAPKCNCYDCWNFWFVSHPGIAAAINAMLGKVGADTVIKVIGTKYFKHFKRFLTVQEYW